MADIYDQGQQFLAGLAQSYQDKITQLQDAKNKKLAQLSGGRDATLLGLNDGDGPITSEGTIREQAANGMYYDANELPKPGFKADKSSKAMQYQDLLTARKVGKDVSSITDQDRLDVANWQQVQKLGDLVNGPGVWEAPFARGTEKINLTGRYIDENGIQQEAPLNVPIKVNLTGQVDKYNRKLGQVGSVDGTDVTTTSANNPELNARYTAPVSKDAAVNDDVMQRAYGAIATSASNTPIERAANAGKAVAFRALEGVANTVDLAAEAGEYLYKNATGKDTDWSEVKGLFGEKEEKALKSFIGYNDKPMQKAAEEAKQAAMDAYENGDWWGVVKAVGKGLTTPELAGESGGFIIGMLLPGGIATKGLRGVSGVAKEAKAIQAVAQASGTEMKLADAVKIAEEGADLSYHLTKKLAGQSGQIGYAEQVAREADAEYKKLYGEEQSAERRMGSFLLGLVSANMDAAMGKMIMVGKDPMAQAVRTALLQATPKQGAGFVKTLAASTGIATGRIIGAMAEEGFTEGIQSSLELTAERYKDGTLGGMSGKEIAGRVGSEAILGAAGGAQFAGPSTAKQFLFGEKKEAVAPTIDEAEQVFTAGVGAVDNLIKGEDVEGEATGEFAGFDTSVTYDADVVKPVIEAMLLKPKESYTKDEQDFFRSNKDTFEAVAAEGYEKLKAARGQQIADVQAEVEENSAILNWAATGEGEMPAPTSTINQETLDRIQSIYDNDALTKNKKAIEIDQIPELKGIASKAVILGEAGSAATIEDKVTKANKIRTAMLRSGTTEEEADVVSRLVFSLGAGVGMDLQWKDDTKEQLEGAVDAQQVEGGPGAKVVTVERVLRKGTVADQTVEETRDGMPVAAFSDAQVMAIATGNVDVLGEVVSKSSKLTTSLNRLRDFSGSRVGKQAREQINKVATAISGVAENSGIAFVDNAKSPEAKQAAAFRVAVVALNQIHSALVSSTHEALRDDMTTMPQGAALYKVAAQIGKDLVHSYGLNFRGADATVAEAYTKLGLQALKLVNAAGLIEYIDNDIVPESKNLKTATGDKVKAAQVGLKEITSIDVNNDSVMVGKSVRLADLNTEDKSPKGVAAGSEMASALKLLKPILMLGNRELPAKSPSNEKAITDKPKGFSTKYRLNPETGEVEKFSESQDTIDKLNNTPLKIKGSMVTLLKLIRDEYENALARKPTMSIMEFINKREWLRDSLGIKDTRAIIGSFLEDSIEAANWAKADALRNVLDSLDDLVPSDDNPNGELYFTYKGDSNDRISLTNTVLNFQHDKVFSRNLMTATEKSTTENKKEFDFLVTEIADESKLSVDEILNNGVNERLDKLIAALNVYSKESKWLPGVVEDTNPLEAIAAEMKPGGLFANAKSGFKVMSLLEAINDIRNRDGYKVETEYMVGADARASGVMNTLANLLGRNTKSSWVANTKKLLGFFGIHFKDEKVPASDPYMALIKKMMDNENVQGATIEEQMSASKLGQLASRVGIKLRDFAKPPIMVWFYGKNSEGIKQTIGDTIALEVFKSAIGFDGKVVNKELAAEVAELLEVDVKALNKMTNDQFKVLAKHYENEYADEMVKTLDKMYPQVVEYRDEMKRIYDLLTGTLDNWKGEFPSAVATMFDETGGDIKTFKDRDVILQDASEDTGWLPLFAHRAMPNATSLPVNPQHSQDAAQLLWTVSRLLASGSGRGGLLTVHDNIMGSVKAVMESQEIYNESYLRSALKYDYMRKAVELVRGLQAQLDKTTEHGLKQFNEINTVIGPIEEKNKEAFEIKNELLKDAKAEMFGIREDDIVDTDNVDVSTDIKEEASNINVGTSVKPAAEAKQVELNKNAEDLYEVVRSGNYVLLDTETIGQNPDSDSTVVHEIAFTEYKNGKAVNTVVINLNQEAILAKGDDLWVPAELEQKGKESERAAFVKALQSKTNTYSTTQEVIDAVEEALAGKSVIAKNAGFDVKVLARVGVNLAGVKNGAVHDYVDKKQDVLLDQLDIKTSNKARHTAEADIENMNKLLQIRAAMAQDRPVSALVKQVSGVKQLLRVLQLAVEDMQNNNPKTAYDIVLSNLADKISKVNDGVTLKITNRFHYNYINGVREIELDKNASIGELVTYLMHEIEHDLTAAYIETNPNAGEVMYLGKVVDALADKTKNKAVSDRVGYILSRGSKAKQVMELVAVLRSEDAAATEIANLLFKEKSESFISRLLETVKSLVRKVWKGNEPITFKNTAAALEQVRQYVNTQDKVTAEAKAETKVKDGTIQAKAEEEINNSALPEEAKQDMLDKLAGCM